MVHFSSRILAAAVALALASPAFASDPAQMQADVMRINNSWAHIRYEVKDRSQQYSQLNRLAEHTTAPDVLASIESQSSGVTPVVRP